VFRQPYHEVVAAEKELDHVVPTREMNGILEIKPRMNNFVLPVLQVQQVVERDIVVLEILFVAPISVIVFYAGSGAFGQYPRHRSSVHYL